MISVRKSEERGLADHGWLKARHTFSFANYYDEKHMGFGVLRVINEDRIQGGRGFGTHPHRDMEIITYVIEGELHHKDSMGNATTIKPGDVQRMSAGTGIQHSEMNGLQDKETHLLQIWILPKEKSIEPSYGQKNFSDLFKSGKLVLVASQSGRQGSITLNQNVDMYVAKTHTAGSHTHKTKPHHHLWVQVVQGSVTVNHTELSAGDGAGLEKVDTLELQWGVKAEFLVFEMQPH